MVYSWARTYRILAVACPYMWSDCTQLYNAMKHWTNNCAGSIVAPMFWHCTSSTAGLYAVCTIRDTVYNRAQLFGVLHSIRDTAAVQRDLTLYKHAYVSLRALTHSASINFCGSRHLHVVLHGVNCYCVHIGRLHRPSVMIRIALCIRKTKKYNHLL